MSGNPINGKYVGGQHSLWNYTTKERCPVIKVRDRYGTVAAMIQYRLVTKNGDGCVICENGGNVIEIHLISSLEGAIHSIGICTPGQGEGPLKAI